MCLLCAEFIVAGHQCNSTTDDKINSCCRTSAPSVKQATSAVHRNPGASPHTPTSSADTTGPPSRPRPVRQSTGGRLFASRHGTTPTRSGDETGVDVQQPARRASAPCYAGNTSTATAVSIHSLLCMQLTLKITNTRRVKPCPHWRLQSRLSPKSATTVAENGDYNFGDYSRQYGRGFRGAITNVTLYGSVKSLVT